MKKIYAIRDTRADYFNPPFFNNTHGEAERNFQNLVNEKDSRIALHPADYDLYYIGDYDDKEGTIVPQKLPQLVASAASLVRSN
ncbi:MAG: DNA binding protein [Malazfec virus 6]